MAPDAAARTPFKQIRLLIVDDEPDLVETLALRFRASGTFAVETASDGEKGLAKAAEFQPDVILLDLVMPNADGWEVCRRLRENPRTESLPVVMMTAHSTVETEDRAREAGVKRLFFKPFDYGELLKSLLEGTAERWEWRQSHE
jgi:DNA-binding response OmpR family regulator